MRFAPLVLTRPGRNLAGLARRGRHLRGLLPGLVLLLVATSLSAAAVHRVAQRNRSFSASEITIAAGEAIAFSNDDEFLHQIYVDSPAMDFDSAEQRPGETITVSFPQSGTFPVRCHIHPKMLLTVHVK